ncbi:MAG: hypothetical protein WKF43_05135 [Acidimicrobiales bacterium]
MDPAQVDELAINNMFVLLRDLWPRWRVRLMALAEVAVAASDCVTVMLRRGGSGSPGGRGETCVGPASSPCCWASPAGAADRALRSGGTA